MSECKASPKLEGGGATGIGLLLYDCQRANLKKIFWGTIALSIRKRGGAGIIYLDGIRQLVIKQRNADAPLRPTQLHIQASWQCKASCTVIASCTVMPVQSIVHCRDSAKHRALLVYKHFSNVQDSVRRSREESKVTSLKHGSTEWAGRDEYLLQY